MRRSVFDMYIAVMRFSINLEENIVVIFSEYMASMLLPSSYVVTEHAPDLTYLSRPEHEVFCTDASIGIYYESTYRSHIFTVHILSSSELYLLYHEPICSP